jgi:two-component system OmpR family response regulator
MKTDILMIEDDFEIADLLSRYLKKFNITVNNYTSPNSALEELNNNFTDYDLIILDLSLPEMDGLEVCKIIKNSEKFKNMPVIITSARGEVSDKVTGLELGADDYIPKPYEPRELVARINAVLRRTGSEVSEQNSSSTKQFGDFSINVDAHEIMFKNKTLSLTQAEFDILKLLINNRNSVLTRDFIAENVEAIDWNSSDRTIDVIISRIRHKMANIDTKAKIDPKKYLLSVRGIGYKFII